MERTVRWASRAAEHHAKAPYHHGHKQYQFAIGQGSVYPHLREACMRELVAMEFDGYAIGGLSVGEPADEMYAMTALSTALMPEHKPRYLMGVGTPEDILRSIALGVDMFDCVMPTRNARNGTLFTSHGRVNAKNAKWKTSTEPIDDGIGCATSASTQMAYLRHLFMAGEILGLILATMQNVAFYLWLVHTARKHILDGTFAEWSADTLARVSSNR
jgi:queuine tRNA-ribosyltransferase